jgi:dipeptidase E
MMEKRLLLLSNSTLPGEPALHWAEPYLKRFLGEQALKILFFPFAGVSFSFDAYYEKVKSRFGDMGYNTVSAHRVSDKQAALENCDAVVVGGGNTFHLLKHLQEGWIELIQKQVQNGKPYVGWSAGANVASPTIKTTNDMPVVEPKSFNALNLAPFQINPHYTEETSPNHGAESRPDRIREFMKLHPSMIVYGIPEGSLLEVQGDRVSFHGQGELKVFKNE